jgi:hypothetical protein
MKPRCLRRPLLRLSPALIAMTLGCGAPEHPCRPFEVSDAYMLLPTIASIGDASTTEFSPTGCTELEGILLCVRGDGRFLQAGFFNRSDRVLSVRWDDIHLLDENGIERDLVEYPDPRPVEVVNPGERSYPQKLVPADKRTFKTSQGITYQEIKPFVPWELEPCPQRPPVDEFFSAGREVVAVIPFTLDGSPQEARYTLRLEAISQSQFYGRLADSGGQ